MKNLKKILIALAILALLVSAAAVVISAEDGTVEKLQEQFDRLANYSDASGKSEQLARTYAYLTDNPIPDGTEGLAELLAKMQEKSVEIVNGVNIDGAEEGNYAGLYKAPIKGDPATSIANINKIRDHFANCPPAEDTAGYQEILNQLNDDAATIAADAQKLAVEATNVFKARAYITSIFAYLAENPLDETVYGEVLKKCRNTAYDMALVLYNEYVSNAAGDADTDTKYFNRYNSAGTLHFFIGQVELPNTDEAKTLVANATAAYKATLAEKQARYEALDAVSDFGAYELTEYHQVIDMEGGTSFKAINPNATNYGEVRDDPETGNKYFTLVQGAESSHLYVEPQNKTDELGLVHTVDMMFGDNFFGCEFVTREPSVGMGGLFQFIDEDRSGDIGLRKSACGVYLDPNQSGDVKGLVTPNVWFNLAVTFDYTERTGSVYVNYVKVMDLNYTQYKFTGFRIGKSGTNQQISLDNYEVYQGTDVRIWDKFQKMSDEQKFMFYVDYFTIDEGEDKSLFSPTNRSNAYLKARELISIIPDSDVIMPYKERFMACNYEDDIRKPAMADNLEVIKGMVAGLPAVEEITSATRNEVALEIESIDAFIEKNNELINRADNSEGGYLDQVAIVDAARDAIKQVINAEDFITAVFKFKRATSYASMSKHAAVAAAIWNEAGYGFDDGEPNAKIKFVEADPVVREFETSLNAEEVLPEDKDNYKTVFEYYTEFAATIAERVKYENSKRIIDCINFIINLEGYEATEEFWGANIEYISKYVTIIRDLIYSRNVAVANNFDLNYGGVDVALRTFYQIDAYCYEALQQQHIKVISEQLEKFVATDSYIEKTGICTYLKAYISENELAVYLVWDEETGNVETIYNTDIVDSVYAEIVDEVAALENLLYVYTLYDGELTAQMDDYTAVLAANTRYFIDTVKVLTSVVSYTDKREILDTATLYYYGMNVDSEEAKAAIVIYNKLLEEVEESEAVAEKFIECVKAIAALDSNTELTAKEKKHELYITLLEGARVRATVDAEIVSALALAEADAEGANVDLIASFDAAVDAYNNNVNKVNSDVENANGITCAVRTNSALYSALAVIAGIVGAN